jgi:hypothetical protein
VTSVSIFGKFLHPGHRINASGTSSKAFLGEKQSPISPYYEENLKLKSPF